MKAILTILLILALTLASCGEPTQNNELTDGENDQGIVSSSNDNAASNTDAPETKDPNAVVIDIPDTKDSAVVIELPKIEYECKLDNGVNITLGSNADEAVKSLIDALGEALDFMEAPSCVHPGNDKVYTFEGFTVTTSPDANGDEYVAELSFLSDSVGFDNGIMIGSSESDVTASFGSEFEESFGVRKYSLDGATLTIIFSDDAVSAMSVSAE